MNEEKAYIRGYIYIYIFLRFTCFFLYSKTRKVCVHVRLKEADTSRRDDLISLDARRNRSLRAVMAKACCFVRTIKGLSCYLLAVMEVMLLTVLCSHFMRINVAPLCANYHLLKDQTRKDI